MLKLRALQGRLGRAFVNYVLVLLPCLSFASSLHAEELGWAWGLSNDSIGDWHDRWQSSSVEIARLQGTAWQGRAPTRFGYLLELRFRSDILTRERWNIVVPSDRRHAGVLSFGIHSYAERNEFEMRAGVDLTVIGHQTGLYAFQTQLHELLGFTIPNLAGVFEIEDQISIDLSGEVAMRFDFGDIDFIPFIEARLGTEDMLRVGVDFELGLGFADDLSLRTVATGQRIPYGLGAGGTGLTLTVGADTAIVNESVYLPSDLGYVLTPRHRIRGGLRYTKNNLSVFYGLSWLGEEFEAQSSGQFVGTIHVSTRF